ncbi:Uncharacterized protein TCM_043479 [Theobroma cacao]|uniref:Uncharacterized protein n=1 Tax=Theobroma cacao TaxID=3641 RepID=A0A061FPW7_THECC|nr:Uncharacterized protein TCM_043479 [Theobroma cacao]
MLTEEISRENEIMAPNQESYGQNQEITIAYRFSSKNKKKKIIAFKDKKEVRDKGDAKALNKTNLPRLASLDNIKKTRDELKSNGLVSSQITNFKTHTSKFKKYIMYFGGPSKTSDDGLSIKAKEMRLMVVDKAKNQTPIFDPGSLSFIGFGYHLDPHESKAYDNRRDIPIDTYYRNANRNPARLTYQLLSFPVQYRVSSILRCFSSVITCYSMHVLSWNCRGILNKKCHKNCKELVRTYAPNILVLLEIKCGEKGLVSTFAKKIGFDGLSMVLPTGLGRASTGGLIHNADDEWFGPPRESETQPTPKNGCVSDVKTCLWIWVIEQPWRSQWDTLTKILLMVIVYSLGLCNHNLTPLPIHFSGLGQFVDS